METTTGGGDAPDVMRSQPNFGGRSARRIFEILEPSMSPRPQSTVGSTGRVAVHSPRPLPDGVPSSGEQMSLLGGNAAVVGVEKSPPLVVWIGPALACALAYALYNIFIKKGSASINPVLGGVILQLVAALLGSCLLGASVLVGEGGAAEVIQYDRSGVVWAVWAGAMVGIAEMISFCVSGMGVQATQSIPIIIGGSVMFGSVLGLIMLGEVMTAQGWLGVLLLVVGISLVATDPGQNQASY